MISMTEKMLAITTWHCQNENQYWISMYHILQSQTHTRQLHIIWYDYWFISCRIANIFRARFEIESFILECAYKCQANIKLNCEKKKHSNDFIGWLFQRRKKEKTQQLQSMFSFHFTISVTQLIVWLAIFVQKNR